MTRFVLVTALGAVLASTVHGAQGQDWRNWQDCDALLTSGKEVPIGERRLSETLTKEELRDAHQIVFINNSTGKLEVNHNATVWNALLTVHQEVNLIVTFGLGQSGMSTMASMLACAMNDADEDTTTIFPAQKAQSCVGSGCHLDWPSTRGIWATDPFTYSGPDGGEPKTYMILDTQGMDAAHQLIQGLSTKLYNDANVKMLAMLSEIASEFIYVTGNPAAATAGGEFDSLGLTLKSTRENLVKTGEEYLSDAEKKVMINTTNHPGLLFVTREVLGKDIVKEDNFTFDTPLWDRYTATYYNSITDADPDFGALLEANYKLHTVNDNGQEKEVAWNYNPLPDMDDVIAGDQTFRWAAKEFPFPLEKGASCRQYKNMNNNLCTRPDPNDNLKSTPFRPPTYKLMIDSLAAQIYSHAPVRQVRWGTMTEAVGLTGTRVKGFLEAGVTEINKAGVVADNELWRLIASDRCMADLNAQIELYYGSKRDELAAINDAVKADNTLAETEIETRNATMVATWTTAAEQFDTVVESFFLQNTLLTSVRESCTAEAYGIYELISLQAWKKIHDMDYQREKARTRDLEAQREAMQNEIARLTEEMDKLWWEANLPYFIAMGFLGLAVLYIFTRMFAQLCGTARSCLACCDDLSTQDHTHKIELTNRWAPRIPGIAVAPGDMNMGGEPAVHQRIEDLEAVVMQLAARLPKAEVEAMGLQKYTPPASMRMGCDGNDP